jgi:Tfp pilus assembly protein PilF
LWLQSGLAKEEQRDFSGARHDAEQFLTRRPDDLRGARLLAEAVSSLSGNPPALAMLKQMAAQHPHAAGWNHLYGEWLLRADDAQGARRAFEAAAAADPAFLGAGLALANLDLSEGRNESARDRLLEALKAEPRNVAALLMMAEAEQRLGDNASANARYVTILGVDSGNIVALNNLAYALARQDPDAALPYAQRALESQPGSAAVQDTLGWVYYRKSMYPTAVQYLKASADAEPTAKHEFHLAMAYLKNGDRAQGQTLLRAALGKDPNLPKTETGW